MGKVEKAVIDLGGELPRHSFKNRKEGQYYVDGLAIKQVRGLTTKHICSVGEFMEARKRLENKPTEWLDGYFYKIQAQSGHWWFSKKEPRHNHQGEIECGGHGNLMYSGNIGEPFNWQQSLERRPESNPEPEWVPGVDLPPVGVDCEFLDSSGRWHHVTITAHALLGVCFVEKERDGENYTAKDARKFRAIKSHKERVIEAAQKATGVKQKFCALLYDAGMLKLPEDSR